MMKMSEIWKQKIREIDEIINNTDIGKDGRLQQLYRKRQILEEALMRCVL